MAQGIRHLIRKAANDLQRYSTVLENTAQSRSFYKKLNKKTAFVALTKTVVLETRDKDYPIIDTGSVQLLHPGEEGKALEANQEYAPVPSTIKLESKMFRGRVRITRELLESNLAKAGLTPIIRAATDEKLSQEIEDIHLLGVGPTGGVGYKNPIGTHMRLQEGWIERMRQVNEYDCNDAPLSEARLFEMLNVLPSQHVLPRVRNFMNHRAMLALQKDLASRATGLGDRNVVGSAAGLGLTVAGMPITMVPRIPDTWGTQTDDKTFAFMCDPKKAWLGYFRRPDFEMFRDPMTGTWFLVISMRMGNQWIDTDGTVFAKNVGLLESAVP